MNLSQVERYLNRDDVRAALYVSEDVNHVTEYTMCSQVLNYTVDVPSGMFYFLLSTC